MENVESIINSLDNDIHTYLRKEQNYKKVVEYSYRGQIHTTSLFTFDSCDRLYFILQKKNLVVLNDPGFKFVKDIPDTFVFKVEKVKWHHRSLFRRHYYINYHIIKGYIYDDNHCIIKHGVCNYNVNRIVVYKEKLPNTIKVYISPDTMLRTSDDSTTTCVYTPVEMSSSFK